MFFNNQYGVYQIKIEDVDISKPWRIHDYDGTESIEYFEGLVVEDKETNMCKW